MGVLLCIYVILCPWKDYKQGESSKEARSGLEIVEGSWRQDQLQEMLY